MEGLEGLMMRRAKSLETIDVMNHLKKTYVNIFLLLDMLYSMFPFMDIHFVLVKDFKCQ